MKIGNGVELESEVVDYIRLHEKQIQEALKLYYSKFTGNGDGLTFHAACSRNKINPSYVIDYMAMNNLSMPETRKEAEEYSKKLNIL